MKYIVMIAAAYAAMVIGMNVAHANGVVEMKFDTIDIVGSDRTVEGCLVDVNGEQRVYVADCAELAARTVNELRKDEPNVFLHVTINGVEINKS
jgi:hypothetical protein